MIRQFPLDTIKDWLWGLYKGCLDPPPPAPSTHDQDILTSLVPVNEATTWPVDLRGQGQSLKEKAQMMGAKSRTEW